MDSAKRVRPPARAAFRSLFQAALVGAAAVALQTAPGRQGPRRVASPGRPITRSGRGPRAGAARWMEDRGRMVDANEALVLGREGDRSGIGGDGGTKEDGPVAIALGRDGGHGRKRDGRVSGAERPGTRRRPRRWDLVVGWEHRPAQDQWVEGECLRGFLRPRGEVVGRTAGSGRGGRGAEQHEERHDRPELQRRRGSLGRGLHCCTGFRRPNCNGSGTRDPMTAADVGLLDLQTRLIEVIAAIKDLRCAKVGRPGGAVGPLPTMAFHGVDWGTEKIEICNESCSMPSCPSAR
jgi:hypothetical protein